LKDTDAYVPWSYMWLARGIWRGAGHRERFRARLVLVHIVTFVVAPSDLVVAGLAERVAQPFETLVKTVTGCGASRLDVLEALLARRWKWRISL
jgi:hypothetical protein